MAVVPCIATRIEHDYYVWDEEEEDWASEQMQGINANAR